MEINDLIGMENQSSVGLKRAIANIAASQTDSSIVTAVAGKKIRVLASFCQAGAVATNVTFNSKPAGAGVAISPIFQDGINGGAVLPFNPMGWFETLVGEGLTVTTGVGSATGILVLYAEVVDLVESGGFVPV
jgi:hypothetical protein